LLLYIDSVCGSRSYIDITQYPLAVGLFGTVCVMMIPQNLGDLVHQLELWIGTKFLLTL